MKTLRKSLWLCGLSAFFLLAGCSSGSNPPVDGGHDDGDGGQVECSTNGDCNDDNACTDDFCDFGKCTHNNNLAACDDGQQCSVNDRCNNGVCVGETSMDCDDDNPCTEDSCDDTQGCVHLSNNAACDDGDACTEGEHCADSQCTGGSQITCDDSNACTDDSCDSSSGCVFTNNSLACDDGQACSTNDHCSNGVCVGDSDRDCDDNNICTEDRCDDALGCLHSYNMAPCDDGSACTDDDKCDHGMCKGGSALDCDDGNVCTTDLCNEQSGCVHNNNSDPCSDGDACTAGDSCEDGECQAGSTRDCNDGQVCTDDSCDSALGCIHNNNMAACDDGNPCTDGDHCAGGTCQPGTSTFDCDDDNDCTDDDCDPVQGCSHQFNTAACNDSDACTMNDVCASGSCQGIPLDADGDGAVADGCFGGDDCCDSGTEAVPGCTAASAAQINKGVFEGTSNAGSCADGIDNDCDGLLDAADPGCQVCSGDPDCDDGNVCNGSEICSGGQCQAGTTLNCNDDKVCTDDSCDAQQGCQHTNNSLFCDDGDPCTLGDQCSGGSCQPGAGTLDCDDGKDCTDDSCITGSGCSNTPDDSNSCSDGDDCTGGDYCSGGDCQPGSEAPDCDDGEDCTDDSCVTGQGCVHTANDSNSCDDGNACTENDYCSAGTCHGTSIACQDGNPCTTDGQCDPQSGCVFPPDDGAGCVHADPCIVNDHCANGFCVGDPQDVDMDTYGDQACGGDDCDDNDPDSHPGAPEICGDEKDNNCNYLADEGCSGCSAVDPDAELVIDNDSFGGAYMIDTDDEALNAFFVESSSYNVIQVKAAFYDFNCDSGGDQGQYSAHIYADDNGSVGQELAASATQTVNRQGGCDPQSDPQDIAWATFILPAPVSFAGGQLFWVAVHSHQQETDDQGNGDAFLPIFCPPALIPYLGGFLHDATDDQYYQANGNWQIRVEGCGDGPWLELQSHSSTPAIAQPGASAGVSASLHNRGFADASGVNGVLSCDQPEMVVTADSASFGNITVDGTANGSPNFSVLPDATAFGIYGISLASSDGANSWSHAFGLYVQGSGCSQDNHTLTSDNDTATYVIPLAAGDMFGNYFAVDSTSFTMTGVEAQFYKTVASPASSNFRVKVYTYLGGAPDQLISTSGWESVSGPGDNTPISHVFNLPTDLTFKQGDTFFALVESQSDLSSLEYFAVLTDDGNNPSWSSGVLWDQSGSSWTAQGISAMIRPHGCQATELSYDSHTSTPASPSPGDTANLSITLKNEGAEDATNVSASISSADADVTVVAGHDSGNYGTIAAGQTKAASGYQVQISSGADEYQYMLDLDITDGTNHWNDRLPLRLAGGVVDLAFSEFTTAVAGNDIHYHFVVTNQGNVDCVAPFRVDLYIDLETPPGANQDGNWSQSYDELAMGDSIPIDLVLSDADPGEYSAYVQCDTLQTVAESNEGNNVDGPSSQTIGTTDVFELLNPPRKWFPQDMPVEFRFVSGNQQSGLTQTEARDAVRNGFQHWQDVAGATITFQETAQTSSGGFASWDGHNTMTFGDPDGDLGTGTLGATITAYTTGQTMVTNGITFYRITDSDIVFNNGVPFGTNAEAAASSCWSSQLTDIEGVATHEEGHLLGLDHPNVQDATMYYAIGPCDPSRVTLATSDINGVTFIYPN